MSKTRIGLAAMWSMLGVAAFAGVWQPRAFDYAIACAVIVVSLFDGSTRRVA